MPTVCMVCPLLSNRLRSTRLPKPARGPCTRLCTPFRKSRCRLARFCRQRRQRGCWAVSRARPVCSSASRPPAPLLRPVGRFSPQLPDGCGFSSVADHLCCPQPPPPRPWPETPPPRGLEPGRALLRLRATSPVWTPSPRSFSGSEIPTCHLVTSALGWQQPHGAVTAPRPLLCLWL